MAPEPDHGPTRIRLTDERRKAILRDLKEFCLETFDEELSDFRAEQVLDFFVRVLGPPVYNQGVQDARAFMLEKLEDLGADLYEREAPA